MVMVEYLDKTGLTYLWGKLKTLLSSKVSKVSSTDNAIARFDGTGGAVQNSGVTINDSNQVTASRFITSGGTSSQVVRGDGTLASASTLSVYEAYLQWGGKNFSGSYGPIDAALVDVLGAPRTMFAKASGIYVEYSRDGGETWAEYSASDSRKVALFSNGDCDFYIGANSTGGASSADYMLRVSLRTGAASIYTVLSKFIIYVSTNGSTGCYCTIRARTQSNYEAGVDQWLNVATKVPITGWSGYNVINTTTLTTYGHMKASQYGEIQFIFGCTGYSGQSSGLRVMKIIGYGGVGWNTPSNMARIGHLYNYDTDQNATFPAKVTATSIVKRGGTSSQFLKADGSVDSNTYVKASDLPATITESEMDGVLGIEESNTEETN